jgi:hypothetical protein
MGKLRSREIGYEDTARSIPGAYFILMFAEDTTIFEKQQLQDYIEKIELPKMEAI